MDNFWKKQQPSKPLFPDALWNKPERKTGKLAIIGGNRNGFAAVAAAYETARRLNVDSAKVILPDSLKKQIPTQIFDATFSESNPSGSFAKNALNELNAASDFADASILIGDSGANAETSTLFENFLRVNSDRKLTVTRDAVDNLIRSAEETLNYPNLHLVLSISQLQKLARSVYYPRVITLSQSLAQTAETLHKFSLTFPVSLTLWHDGQLFFAKNGAVFSQDFDQPVRVWSGEIAVRETIWSIWSSTSDPTQNIISSWTEL